MANAAGRPDRGYGFWRIFIAALVANLTNAGSFATSAAIATGKHLRMRDRRLSGQSLWSAARDFYDADRIALFG